MLQSKATRSAPKKKPQRKPEASPFILAVSMAYVMVSSPPRPAAQTAQGQGRPKVQRRPVHALSVVHVRSPAPDSPGRDSPNDRRLWPSFPPAPPAAAQAAPSLSDMLQVPSLEDQCR